MASSRGVLRVLVAAGMAILASAPAYAMQAADAGPGVELGLGLGAGFGKGTSAFATTGDINYGVHTNFFGQGYTALGADTLDFFTNGNTVSLNTLGIEQPLYRERSNVFGVEGGISYLTDNAPKATLVGNKSGGFVGGRVSILQSESSLSVNGMYRYHFEGAGFWQAGIGISAPLGKRTAWQIDYYRFRTGLNTITAGIRWLFPTGGTRNEP